MEITEQAIHLLAKVATEVQARFTDFSDLAHGWEHVHRVYHLALHLAEQEHADGLIVGMAALLHDLGRTTRGPTRSHAQRSAKLAKKLLASYDLPLRRSTRFSTRSWPIVIVVASNLRRWKRVCSMTRIAWTAWERRGVMRWAMTAKHGRWPQTRTYHPDDPFALWREP